tara:strand:- start:779 stop:1174 length:396 start_codon:yes stop_codon:yes gene_type:complete
MATFPNIFVPIFVPLPTIDALKRRLQENINLDRDYAYEFQNFYCNKELFEDSYNIPIGIKKNRIINKLKEIIQDDQKLNAELDLFFTYCQYIDNNFRALAPPYGSGAPTFEEVCNHIKSNNNGIINRQDFF